MPPPPRRSGARTPGARTRRRTSRTSSPSRPSRRPRPSVADRGQLVERLAELAVLGGANLQRGQILAVSTEPGKEELARAGAAAGFRPRAKFVGVTRFDLPVQ